MKKENTWLFLNVTEAMLSQQETAVLYVVHVALYCTHQFGYKKADQQQQNHHEHDITTAD